MKYTDVGEAAEEAPAEKSFVWLIWGEALRRAALTEVRRFVVTIVQGLVNGNTGLRNRYEKGLRCHGVVQKKIG